MIEKETKIEKTCSGAKDKHQDGTLGVVKDVILIADNEKEGFGKAMIQAGMREEGYLPEAFYMVEFDDQPGLRVALPDFKIKTIS